MKTEPKEAMVYIALYSCENGAGDVIIDREDAEEAVKMAFKEGQSSPKIKQLEWNFYGTYYSAETPVANYLITQENDFIENDDNCALWVNDSLILRGTHEEVKAAAQAGFERRVMECLDL